MKFPWKKQAAKAASTLNAYRRLFSTEDGQEVLKDLMKVCHFNRTIVGKDVHETYFNEGARSVILRVFETCNLTSDEVGKLLDQLNKEEKEIF